MFQKHIQFMLGAGAFMAVGVVSRNVSPSRGMDVYGHSAVCPFNYVGPNPYATGGDPVTPQQFKLGVIEFIDIGLGVSADTLTAVLFTYNFTTAKMQAYQSTTGAPNALVEVANGTDLSGFTARGYAFGKG